MPARNKNAVRAEVVIDASIRARSRDGLVPLVLAAAEAALDAEHSAGPDRVTVMLSGNERLRALNLEFNGLDEVTDVLSFNETDGWSDGVPPAEADSFPGRRQPRLGDIAISVPQVERQAKTAHVPFQQELAMLTVHGVLHLLGYDHATPSTEQVMNEKTERILTTVMARAGAASGLKASAN